MNTADVVQQLWQAPAPLLRPTDVAQLGPAPRSCSEAMDRYVRQTVKTAAPIWAGLAVVTVLADVMAFWAGAPHVPVLSILLVALMAYSFRARAQARARVRVTLQGAELQRAMVKGMRIVEHRTMRGRVLYTEFQTTFVVADGREVVHRTRDHAMAMLQDGMSEEVLWSPTQPDIVVPTFLLA